jgi:hypothetical protein
MTDYFMHPYSSAPARHPLTQSLLALGWVGTRILGAGRYALVWLVWLVLFVVRPKLALESFRYRRMDSPIARGMRGI